MSKQIMTDVQLAELHDDIRDGVSMIVAVDHYYHLTQQRDDLRTACEDALAGINKPAVQCQGDWQTGMFCGLEDRGITDRYEACMYGYERALEKVQEWVLCDFEAAIANAQPSKQSVAPKKSGTNR